MSIFQPKSLTLFGVVFAVAAFAGLPSSASAQPGAPTNLKGYGLMMWQREHAARPTYSVASPARSFSTPRSYGYVAAPSSAVVAAPAPAVTVPAPATVAIRGPDGVVRSFPVQGGTVQQQAAAPGQAVQSFVTVRDADGVVRTYPVAQPTATTGQAVVTPSLAAPTATPNCCR